MGPYMSISYEYVWVIYIRILPKHPRTVFSMTVERESEWEWHLVEAYRMDLFKREKNRF